MIHATALLAFVLFGDAETSEAEAQGEAPRLAVVGTSPLSATSSDALGAFEDSQKSYTWLWVTGVAVTASGWLAHGLIATLLNSRALPWPWVPLAGPWISVGLNPEAAWAHLLAAAWQYSGVALTVVGLLLHRAAYAERTPRHTGFAIAPCAAPSGVGVVLELP